MSKKYYAVKIGLEGRKIYDSWEECERNVKGFPGAQFKSFKSLEEAEQFVGGVTLNQMTDEVKPLSNGVVAYVDGSFNKNTYNYGSGAVILHNGEIIDKISENGNDPALTSMRNVAGEIKACEYAIKRIMELGYKEVDIYYDYMGIEMWANGKWQTNIGGTKAYKEFINECRHNKIVINFHKVKAHSNDEYNDMADELAKEACGVIERDEPER